MLRGIVSFFHRDEPGRIRVITRGAVAGVEGTEFVMAADDTERTTLSVIDGKVRFGNEQATLLLTNGQQAVVEPGKAPVRTAGFIANNVLQWCFYYPAVIDPDDLPFTPDEQKILGESLQAYRSGDLLVALAKYPAGQPARLRRRAGVLCRPAAGGRTGRTGRDGAGFTVRRRCLQPVRNGLPRPCAGSSLP